MQDWMTALASHYRQARMRHPHDRLLIVFDIDGTILDMRYRVLHMLQAYDREHQTQWFAHLTIADIASGENVITGLLIRLAVPDQVRESVQAWYDEHSRAEEAMAGADHPVDGVMQVIRWLQAQPNVFVALNSGRFEAQRDDTLRTLNKLGARHGARFQHRLGYFRSDTWQRSVPESKVHGLRQFQVLGYRPIAVLDNEPENLAAMAAYDHTKTMLLMHADTLYLSDHATLPARAVRGAVYNATKLAYLAMAHIPGAANARPRSLYLQQDDTR